MKSFLVKKIGMTQIFDTEGKAIPVTIAYAEPNLVIQVKELAKDFTSAYKLGFIEKKASRTNKPMMGEFTKINATPKQYMKEVKSFGEYKAGDLIKVEEVFSIGDFVDVQSISKGKGFQGSIKRHNYKIGPKAHGSGYHRGVGSMGSIAPNRVFKSKVMPGHMGNETVTVQNLKIVDIVPEQNILVISGPVPGPKKSLLVVKSAVKKVNKPNVKLNDIYIPSGSTKQVEKE